MQSTGGAFLDTNFALCRGFPRNNVSIKAAVTNGAVEGGSRVHSQVPS